MTIPTISVSLELGDALGAEQPRVEGRIFADPRILAGTSNGFVRLFAPDSVKPGSSKSHRDTTALPNLLMKPSVSPDLESATTLDLSPSLFLDLGWRPCCEIRADTAWRRGRIGARWKSTSAISARRRGW